MYLWVVERCIRKIFLKKAHVETWNKNIYTHTYRYIYTHTYRYIYVLHNEESYLVYCIKTLLYYSFRYFHNQEKKKLLLVSCLFGFLFNFSISLSFFIFFYFKGEILYNGYVIIHMMFCRPGSPAELIRFHLPTI